MGNGNLKEHNLHISCISRDKELLRPPTHTQGALGTCEIEVIWPRNPARNGVLGRDKDTSINQLN